MFNNNSQYLLRSMYKTYLHWLVGLLWLATHQLYAQNNQAFVFEQAKLKLLCEAIRFNYRYQGQALYLKTLDCSSLPALGRSIPSSFKSSTRLYQQYAHQSYAQLPDLASRLDKLSKDLIAELEGIGQVAHGNKPEELQKWNRGLQELMAQFHNICQQALLSTNPPEEEEHKQAEKHSAASKQQAIEEESSEPLPSSATHKTDSYAHTHHGLWIITILSCLIALVACGMTYLIYVRTKSEVQLLRETLYERYNLLDQRFDYFYQQLQKQEEDQPK